MPDPDIFKDKSSKPKIVNPNFISPLVILLGASTFSQGALTDQFDAFPNGGTGWAADWVTSAGLNPTLAGTAPVNGGGQYLSAVNTANSTNFGITRNIGSLTSSIYTLTFDWRLDSTLDTFTSFNDRVHFGSNSDASFGTSANWGWIIGVSAADNGTTNTVHNGNWYFYNNRSTGGNGGFVQEDMVNTGIALAPNVTYSFTVTVNSATQTYSAAILGSDGSTFSEADLNFRNQSTPGTGQSNLVFGGAVSPATGSPLETMTWSLDNINVVPEPSSALLAGISGLLCFVRRRIVH